jgi:RND family efflux transporter MFP subunit
LLCCLLALTVLALGLVTPTRAGEPAAKKAALPSRPSGLEWFRKMTPEERLKQVEKVSGGATAFARVTRADLDVTILERGSVEPASGSDLYCLVRSGSRGSTSSTVIKWIIDDGTQVKRGDKLVELDSSGFQDQLKDRTRDVDNASALKAAAEAMLKIQRLQNKLELRSAEIGLKQAKRALAKYAGDDKDEKEVLKERVEIQELSLELVKLTSKAREDQHLADVKAKAGILDQELARQREIEDQIAKCTVRAPQDGMVVYHVPEQVRSGGSTQQSVVAQGEPVREGQKLLRVCSLDRFVVTVRVHEALIARVRVGQSAVLRVDALPRQLLRGRVTAVSTIASQLDWFASDVKVYRVRVRLDDKSSGLKPGMSGGVLIEVDRRPKVLQVPVEAVVRSGRETFCFVKVGKELQERKVTTGERNHLNVEIKEGLKEDEQVLRSPRGAAARSQANAGVSPAGARLLVRGIRLGPTSLRRSWIVSYGLTYRDLERIRALPDVTETAAVRAFPTEAYHRERRNNGFVIATDPEHRKLAGLRLAAGRFLDEEDGRQLANVAVLGATAAETLFPDAEPLGEVVRLGSFGYRVVGVLREQDRPAGSLTAAEADAGVYIPLQTGKRRFGERVIVTRAGNRTGEAVPLSEILVGTRSPGQERFVGACITAILEETHPRKDWEVQAIGSPR